MFKYFSSIFLISLSTLSVAQNSQIERLSWRLSAIGFDMVECRKDSERDSCIDLFNKNIDSLMDLPGSYRHQFDSVANIRILPSPDNKFRILTWGFRHPNDSFSFYGIIQYADENKEWVKLEDNAHQIGNQAVSYFAELNPENWFGALYYQIEKISYKHETYYILLGWNGKTNKTDWKIADVLSWNEQDEIVFGLPVFDMAGNSGAYQNRVIWEYKNGANMSLQIEGKEKLITFDHIEPADSRAKGIYTLYIPDGTYDFFKYKKGIWFLETNLYEHFKNPGRD